MMCIGNLIFYDCIICRAPACRNIFGDQYFWLIICCMFRLLRFFSTSTPKDTCLKQLHLARGGKIVDFAGTR